MTPYIGTKRVYAVSMSRLQYNQKRGWELPADENGADEGYLVEYVDGGQANHPDYKGYISWSPKDVFERSYRPNQMLTFGLAIEAMKAGYKVARTGWNGKGMYLWLLPAAEVKKEWVKDPMLLSVFGDRDTLSCLGSIRMLTATGEVLTGWLASQTDMLAEDWEIVG